MRRKLFTLITLGALGAGVAQEKDPFGKPDPPKKPNIKEIAPGVLQVGTVRLEKKMREIHLPVTINMNEGPLEYLVVTGKGKVHESLLVTTVEPFHLQVAMLLLNCKGSDGHLIPEDDSKPVPGNPVVMELHWKEGKKKKKSRLEKFFKRADGEKVKEGTFVFNGSRVFDGIFLAQRDGSIVSLITDNAAQFNNPRKGRDNDDLWRPQPKGLPPLDSNGTLVVRVLPTVKKTKKSAVVKLSDLEKRDAEGNSIGLPETGLWFKRGEKEPYTGLVEAFYNNGKMESKIHYEKGVRAGIESHWYENGTKRWEMIYKSGRMVSMKQWDVDGNEQKK